MLFTFPYIDQDRTRQEIEIEADTADEALILAVQELHRRDPA